ncbi:hypothetical protein [Halocola ammonii]
MRRILFFTWTLLASSLLLAQNDSNSLKVLVSSRVDTSNSDVRAVIDLYENYYNSKPDSIYDNPYWNKKEKELYRDFDFSRASIFQGDMNAEKLFRYFSPFVMSVEPIGEKYQIRVLFSSPTTDPEYAGSKVWCIQKLNAIREGEKWVLENLIVELAKNWSTEKVGFIEYVFPTGHQFDRKEANRADQFCREMIERFNPDYNEAFKFFVTNSTDDMGLLENFDYYFVGITTGKAREGMILTAKGNEFYPHELIHKLLPPNPNRAHVIEEGLATFLGTRQDPMEYEQLMKKLATDLREAPDKVNFKSVLSQSVSSNGYQTAYPAGAAICELVYEKSGDEGLIQLMKADTTTYKDIIKAVSSITELSEEEIEEEWKMIF